MANQITKGDIAKCIGQCLNKSQAAVRLGVSTKVLNKQLAELDIVYPYPSKRLHQKSLKATERVVEYVVSHGGSIPNAIRQLNLDVSIVTIRKHLKEKGIDLSPYRSAYKRYGAWEVLPQTSSSENTLLCRCTKCGAIKDVSKHALYNERSRQCMSCAARERRSTPVAALNGTEVVFTSILSFTNHFSLDYQGTKGKLLSGEQVTVNNQQFVLQ